MQSLLSYVDSNRDRYLSELKTLLAIPSVSTNPENNDDVRRCAAWMADHMKSIGIQNVEIFPTAGHPVVYGDWLKAPGKPTVLLYGHYDVQPPEPLDLWTSPPFEATIRDGRLYARGAADDKGQVFIHLKAVEAIMKESGRLPVNLKMLIEGEEEVGSENFFLFGLTAEQVQQLKTSGYRPNEYYEQNPRLREVLDYIASNTLTGGNDNLFGPLVDDLIWHDPFLLLADYQAYINSQDKVSELWRDQRAWTRMSILNVARMGKFSSDRSIRDY